MTCTFTVLVDEEFESELSDRDYEQKIKFYNGEYNYALRNNVEGVEDITDAIYYDNNDIFAIYSIEFERPLDLSTSKDLKEDLVGSSLKIMDLDFMVVSAKRDGSDLEELEIVGGSERILLKEKETKIIEIDNQIYKIEVNIVAENKVSLIINDEFISLDIYETYEFGNNTSVTVVELVNSERNSILGHVELIIGGQKILLGDNKDIELNGDKINDLFENYNVVSDFSDNQEGMNIIEIIYSVEDEVLLEEGDVLKDVLFNVFEIHYEGQERFEYSNFELNVNDEIISIDAILFNDENFKRDLIYTNTSNGIDETTYIKGNKDENRIFFKGSNIDLFLPKGINKVSGNEILINFTNNDIDGNGFLIFEDLDEQYLYEINDVDTSEGLIDIEEIFENNVDEDLEASDFISQIRVDLNNAIANDENKNLQLDLNEFNSPIIAFENDLIMDLSQVESTGVSGLIKFYLDVNDVNGESIDDVDEVYNINLNWDDNNNEFELLIDQNDEDFVNRGIAETSDSNSDRKKYVTSYGTIINYDTDEKDFIIIRVPDEQIIGEATITFGGSSTNLKSIIVDSEDYSDEIFELERNGFEIVETKNLSSNQVVLDENGSYVSRIVFDDEIDNIRNKIIVGGPAINKAAAQILGVDFPTYGFETELNKNQGIIRYYDDLESVLIYGYEYKDTIYVVNKFLERENRGDETFFDTQ